MVFNKIKEIIGKGKKTFEKEKDYITLKIKEAKKDKIIKKSNKTNNNKKISEQIDYPIPTGKGFSKFQKRIIRRELIMKRVRETPPMDRIKMLNRSEPFRATIRKIRGIEEPINSGLIKNSLPQQAQHELRGKLIESNNINNNGLKTDFFRKEIISPKLKAPIKLL